MSIINEPRVLVCVTGQKSCERLIEEGASIAQEHNIELSVVHVAKTGNNFLGSTSGITEAEASAKTMMPIWPCCAAMMSSPPS